MLFLWIGIILIVIIALLMSLSVFLTRRHPQQVFSSPTEYGLEFEEIAFKTLDQVRLQGWWIPADNSKRTIIFLHGYSGSMDPDLKYTPYLHQSGYNILMFDFRAHGRSEGKMTTLGALEVQDVLAAIRHAQSLGSRQIGLLGFSMGGRTALLAVEQSNSGISSIISDGGPLRLSNTILQQLKEKHIPRGVRHLLTWSMLLGASIRSGENLFMIDPIRHASELTGLPVLLIHAELDSYTKIVDLNSLVVEIGINAKLEVIPGVKHRDTDNLDFASYISKIIEFFDSTLKS
jgi:alpha-beta hydrolase superfamily lysophospholipase